MAAESILRDLLDRDPQRARVDRKILGRFHGLLPALPAVPTRCCSTRCRAIARAAHLSSSFVVPRPFSPRRRWRNALPAAAAAVGTIVAAIFLPARVRLDLRDAVTITVDVRAASAAVTASLRPRACRPGRGFILADLAAPASRWIRVYVAVAAAVALGAVREADPSAAAPPLGSAGAARATAFFAAAAAFPVDATTATLPVLLARTRAVSWSRHNGFPCSGDYGGGGSFRCPLRRRQLRGRI